MSVCVCACAVKELNRRRNRPEKEEPHRVYLRFYPYFPLPRCEGDDDDGYHVVVVVVAVACLLCLLVRYLRLFVGYLDTMRVLALSAMHTLARIVASRISVQSRFHFGLVYSPISRGARKLSVKRILQSGTREKISVAVDSSYNMIRSFYLLGLMVELITRLFAILG